MNSDRRKFIKQSAMASAVLGLQSLPFNMMANPVANEIRIGIIGLDTSHSPAFTEIFNAENPEPGISGFRVVAAYPQGSEDIKSSVDTIPEYTQKMRDMGVEIVDSVKKLLDKVDVVLLETNDGRPHLEQAREVFKAGKTVFIDKPISGSLSDAVKIFREAEESKVAVFSASALRYLSNVQAVRYDNKIGPVLGADTYSPASLEPHHPDLFWYGIHGVEILFSVMGTGCKEVSRFRTDDTDIVVGKWNDGRIGTFRGTRNGTHDYGGIAFGTTGNLVLGTFEGYQPLIVKIAEFFRTKVPPVEARETLEIYAFMEAADESWRRAGGVVSLEEVLKKSA